MIGQKVLSSCNLWEEKDVGDHHGGEQGRVAQKEGRRIHGYGGKEMGAWGG